MTWMVDPNHPRACPANPPQLRRGGPRQPPPPPPRGFPGTPAATEAGAALQTAPARSWVGGRPARQAGRRDVFVRARQLPPLAGRLTTNDKLGLPPAPAHLQPVGDIARPVR